MSKISPYYRVNVIDQFGKLVYAHLEEAEKSDMPPISKQDWTFNWQGFWKQADFECETLVKLTHQGTILGLIRFGLYPFPHKQTPEFVYVSHLQCVRKAHRVVNPVGFWLLWYVAQIALESCAGNSQESIILLDSMEGAIPYYRDKVRMEGLGWITLSPSESGYAFRFTQEKARQFCRRVEGLYGEPLYVS